MISTELRFFLPPRYYDAGEESLEDTRITTESSAREFFFVVVCVFLKGGDGAI